MKRRTLTSSPAQRRQQHLFQRKGQFASMKAFADNIMYDTSLTIALRAKANDIYLLAREAEEIFNKEVGWK